MDRFNEWVERIARALEALITAILGVIVVITILLVLLRYGLNQSIKGGNELINYLFIYTTGIGASLALWRHDHIKIDYFVNKLSGNVRKASEIVVQLFVILINAVLVVLSVPWIRQVGSFRSPVLRLPNSIVQAIIPIGCTLAVLFCVANILMTLTGTAPPQEDTVDVVAPE